MSFQPEINKQCILFSFYSILRNPFKIFTKGEYTHNRKNFIRNNSRGNKGTYSIFNRYYIKEIAENYFCYYLYCSYLLPITISWIMGALCIVDASGYLSITAPKYILWRHLRLKLNPFANELLNGPVVKMSRKMSRK